jgi:hypothetical protein
MRSSALFLGLILVGGASTAMAQEYSGGVKAGVNFAKLHFDGDEADNSAIDNRTGLVAGVFIVWPASGRLAVQTEALYSQKGATFHEEGASGSVKLDYLDVPILLRLSTPASNGTSFHVFGGPSLGVRLRARSEIEFQGETESEDFSDEVERFDLGLVAGAGVEFGRVVIDGRYTWGLSNLNTRADDDVKIRHRVFSIMAGVKF